MYRNDNLLLMHALVVTDLLTAVGTIPYIAYLIANWDPNNILLNPHYIMISSLQLAFQLKVNLVIITAIAIDRLLALFSPAMYRRKNHKIYAFIAMTAAHLFGAFDVILEFKMSAWVPVVNCAAIGCYVGDHFRYYWGTSNAIMGMFVMWLILVMIYKLKYLAANQFATETGREKWKFEKANRSAVCTLLSSLICITIPSVFAGVYEMTGNSIFRTLGPFYLVGLLSAGCVHSMSQLVMNRELSTKLRHYVGLKTSTTVTAIEAASRWDSKWSSRKS